MLKIRLKRTGKKGEPHYRVVIAEAHKSRDGKSIEEIGYYNPRTSPSTVKIDKEAVEKWLKFGAQPTKTVEQLLVKEGILSEIKRGSKLPQNKRKKKAGDEPEEAPEVTESKEVAAEEPVAEEEKAQE